MSDLLWSDPDEKCNFKINLFHNFIVVKDWSISPRGAGYLFGKNIVDQFIYKNKIETIVRAH